MYSLKELMQSIVKSSPIGYLVSDEYGKISFVNEKIELISGLSSKELVNQDVKNICTFPESMKQASANDNVLSDFQAAVILRKDGTKLTAPARIVEIRDLMKLKKFAGYLIMFHFENKTDSSVDKAQMEFVSTVSHELRTPLTSIKGFSETLLRTWDKLTTDVKRKYITIIKEQSERLTRLVEDLLAVSRLESHNYKLTIRAVDINKLIYKVCDSLAAKSVNHKIEINIEKNIPEVKADPDRLEQILTNLIDNAIKYSLNNTTVTVKASSVSNGQNIKDKIKIQVTDHGIGIKEADLPKIFTKFGRLDNPLTRQAQGTGLGLFITKSLVISLKGEIFAESKEGETVFTVILPAEVPVDAILLSSSIEQKVDNK